MTFDQLEHTLANGLHDAELLGLSVDYVRRNLTLTLDIFVGDFEAPIEKREAYRKAHVTVTGLQFFVIEAPAADYPYNDAKPSRIDVCDLSKNLDANLLKSLPVGTFVVSIWVSNWNAFMHMAATDAQLFWQDEAITYREKREHYLPGEMIELQ